MPTSPSPSEPTTPSESSTPAEPSTTSLAPSTRSGPTGPATGLSSSASSSGAPGLSGPGARARLRHHLAGPGLVCTAAVLWGTVGVAGQLVVDRTELAPVTVGLYRLVVAAAVMAVAVAVAAAAVAAAAAVRPGLDEQGVPGWLTRAARPSPSTRIVLRLVGIGMGLAAYQAAFFTAAAAAGVAVATLVTLGLAPVLVSLGARWLLSEPLTVGMGAALTFALSGLVLLVTDSAAADSGIAPAADSAPGTGHAPLVGVAVAIGSAAGYAAVTLAARSMPTGVAPSTVATAGFGVGAVVLLPVVAVAGELRLPADPVALGLLAYLGVVPTAIAYGLFFLGLRATPAARASVLTLLEPVTAAALAGVVLGESLGGLGVLGGGLLLASVAAIAALRSPRA